VKFVQVSILLLLTQRQHLLRLRMRFWLHIRHRHAPEVSIVRTLVLVCSYLESFLGPVG
jgi:hypothetical protein